MISPIIIGVLFNAIIYGRNSVLMEVRRLFNPSAVFALNSQPMVRISQEVIINLEEQRDITIVEYNPT